MSITTHDTAATIAGLRALEQWMAAHPDVVVIRGRYEAIVALTTLGAMDHGTLTCLLHDGAGPHEVTSEAPGPHFVTHRRDFGGGVELSYTGLTSAGEL